MCVRTQFSNDLRFVFCNWDYVALSFRYKMSEATILLDSSFEKSEGR